MARRRPRRKSVASRGGASSSYTSPAAGSGAGKDWQWQGHSGRHPYFPLFLLKVGAKLSRSPCCSQP